MDLEVLGGCMEMHFFWLCSSFCDRCLSTWHELGSVPGVLRALSHRALTLIS